MRKLTLVFSVLVVLSMLLSACGTPATPTTAPVAPADNTAVPPVVVPTAEPVKGLTQVYWYIGLGTGSQAAQIPLEKAWVEKYNAGQGAKDGIQLITIIVDNKFARDNLLAQMAAGNTPDIVGPVGTEGRGWVEDQVLDLQPLVDKVGYDLSKVDPAFLKFYQTKNGLVGLPFAIYPSALFYNKALFDAAALAYPPHKVGEKYKLDGADVDWDFTTVAKIAKRLTLDSNGVSADQKGFDPKKIAQWGFDFQWTKDSVRWFSAYFDSSYPVSADGKAVLSEGEIAAIKWYYDGMWGKEPFIPTQAAGAGDLLKGNNFDSGKVAMGLSHLWYTCCITGTSDAKANVKSWDVGVVPSYNGKTTAKMHADTFSIMKASKNPEAAFKVYAYLVGEGAPELTTIYGAFPTDKSAQVAFLASLDTKYSPNKIDWPVFVDMIGYLEVPGHELLLPNAAKAHDGFLKFGSQLASTPGLDIDKTIAEFLTAETAIYTEAPAK